MSRAASPFTWRGVLAIVLIGVGLFVALLWMIGAGVDRGNTNDGGGHVYGRGANGYYALAALLEARGVPVRRSRTRGAERSRGLLVLTPEHYADPDEIDKLVGGHRHYGPTLLVLPKWQASPIPQAERIRTKSRPGWVWLFDVQSPYWAKKLAFGDLGPAIGETKGPWRARGLAGGLSGPLAAPDKTQVIRRGRVLPLVEDGEGDTLVAVIDNGGVSQALLDAAGLAGEADEDGNYPVIVVAEPDLLDNRGLADRRTALLALALIDLMREPDEEGQSDMPVVFDTTLNGLTASNNLLTLAFTPPFLAATLCLLLAALAVGWRGFVRFGPAVVPERAIAFGKRALVSNTAGMVRRSRRLHLLSGPYAERSRSRLLRALALPRHLDAEAADRAIDRALLARHRTGEPEPEPYSIVAARLTRARTPHDLVKAARDLHALERKLIR